MDKIWRRRGATCLAGEGIRSLEPGESRARHTALLSRREAAALPAAAWEQRATEHKINTLAHQEMLMQARGGIASYGQAICAEQISLIKTWCKSAHFSPKSALYPQLEIRNRKNKAPNKVLNTHGKETAKHFAEMKHNEDIKQSFYRHNQAIAMQISGPGGEPHSLEKKVVVWFSMLTHS